MYKLVAHDTQSIENDEQDDAGITTSNRFHGSLHVHIELRLPAITDYVFSQCAPEGFVDKLVADELRIVPEKSLKGMYAACD